MRDDSSQQPPKPDQEVQDYLDMLLAGGAAQEGNQQPVDNESSLKQGSNTGTPTLADLAAAIYGRKIWS